METTPKKSSVKQGHRAGSSMALRYITRIGVSWRVWVQAGMLDCRQVYFNDSDYGGKQGALREAKFHRDDLLVQHQVVLRKYDGNGFHLTHSKNVTDAVGVTLSLDLRDGRSSAYWVANIMRDGKQVHVRRSIRRHGYNEAWAVVARIREKHTGLQYPKHPPAPTKDLLELTVRWGVADDFFERETK